MKRRLLSIMLTLAMVTAIIPGMTITVSAVSIVAQNTTTSNSYTSLQMAVNEIADGETIQLLDNVTENISIPYGNAISFTLDLNGKTLQGFNDVAIKHEGHQIGTGTGNVTLIITDNSLNGDGKVTNATEKDTIKLYKGGELIINGGTVENTNTSVFHGNAIKTEMFATAKVTIDGGTVENTGATYAIYNVGSGDICIYSGKVKANSRTAIYNNVGNKITISGTAEVISDSPNYTMSINSNSSHEPTLEITGGTISNTSASGVAIHFFDSDYGTFKISSGSPVIKGGGMAMDKAPDLSGYANVKITANSTTAAAEDAVVISKEEIDTNEEISSYKFLKFELATSYTISGTIKGSDSLGIGGAMVALKDGSGTIDTTTTDASGDYTFSNIPAGSYTVAASAAGHSNGTLSIDVTDANLTGKNILLAVYVAPPARGGGGSSIPALVTKIESGESVTGINVGGLVKEEKDLTVEGKAGERLVFDTEALKNITGQTKDNVKIEIKNVSEDHKTQHPGKLIFSLTVMAGDKRISNFGNGTATISLPYELKEEEKAEDVTVWYLAEDGTMSEVPCNYDPVTKLATFKVNHFSLYVVGTADTSKWVNPFSDVKESSWFYNSVRYVSANDLMQGTGQTLFSPRAKSTRGMIVTILWRIENEPKAEKAITFADVESGKYYHDAVAWASEKDIVSGYSADKFGPNDSITREQMAVILYNYAASKGLETDATTDLSPFSDDGKINKWGQKAMSWANAEGLIQGAGKNLLAPQGPAERSQVAAILQRFVENTAN